MKWDPKKHSRFQSKNFKNVAFFRCINIIIFIYRQLQEATGTKLLHFLFFGSNHTIQITLLFRCSPGTGVAFPRNGTYNTISGIPNINHARWGNDNFTRIEKKRAIFASPSTKEAVGAAPRHHASDCHPQQLAQHRIRSIGIAIGGQTTLFFQQEVAAVIYRQVVELATLIFWGLSIDTAARIR